METFEPWDYVPISCPKSSDVIIGLGIVNGVVGGQCVGSFQLYAALKRQVDASERVASSRSFFHNSSQSSKWLSERVSLG